MSIQAPNLNTQNALIAVSFNEVAQQVRNQIKTSNVQAISYQNLDNEKETLIQELVNYIFEERGESEKKILVAKTLIHDAKSSDVESRNDAIKEINNQLSGKDDNYSVFGMITTVFANLLGKKPSQSHSEQVKITNENIEILKKEISLLSKNLKNADLDAETSYQMQEALENYEIALKKQEKNQKQLEKGQLIEGFVEKYLTITYSALKKFYENFISEPKTNGDVQRLFEKLELEDALFEKMKEIGVKTLYDPLKETTINLVTQQVKCDPNLVNKAISGSVLRLAYNGQESNKTSQALISKPIESLDLDYKNLQLVSPIASIINLNTNTTLIPVPEFSLLINNASIIGVQTLKTGYENKLKELKENSPSSLKAAITACEILSRDYLKQSIGIFEVGINEKLFMIKAQEHKQLFLQQQLEMTEDANEIENLEKQLNSVVNLKKGLNRQIQQMIKDYPSYLNNMVVNSIETHLIELGEESPSLITN